MTKNYGKPQSRMKRLSNKRFRCNKTLWLTGVLASLLALTSGTVYAQISARMVPIITYLLDEIEEIDNRLKAIPTNKLNDTGITNGMNVGGLTFNSNCDSDMSAPQDCNYGNDLKLNSDADGYAGFSFTFVDDNGELQEPQDKASACGVLDNVTGLMWDTGRSETGLKSPFSTFTWFNSNPIFDGLSSIGKMATCIGYDSNNSSTYCNTEAYVNRLNAANWCGHDDWRLPSINELHGIQIYDDGGGFQNFISTDHFFQTKSWSSTLFLLDESKLGDLDTYFIHYLDPTFKNTIGTSVHKANEFTPVLVVRND